ncbi:hypothetical protein [Pseudomonas sp. 10-1B]|nr:hypothetical protein [Pseudomonas sp. 10-1B]
MNERIAERNRSLTEQALVFSVLILSGSPRSMPPRKWQALA